MMKLKIWLMEKKSMSYAEYRRMPEIEKIILYAEFERYNNNLRKKKKLNGEP